MNESPDDTRRAREAPDLTIASLFMWYANGSDVARKLKVDFETFEWLMKICDAGAAALRRGARLGDLVEAWRQLRPQRMPSEDDVPTVRLRRTTPPPLPPARGRGDE